MEIWWVEVYKKETGVKCYCHTCRPIDYKDPESVYMRLCPSCGNKRCPKATDHNNECTDSNEPNQEGSIYWSWLSLSEYIWVIRDLAPIRCHTKRKTALPVVRRTRSEDYTALALVGITAPILKNSDKPNLLLLLST
jgi:hypothetical protein